MMRFGSICRISLHDARPAPRRILTVAVATAVAGCGAPVASGTAGPSAGVWSYVYSCAGGVRFSARMTADAAYLTLDGRQSELVRDPESPDRYTGDGYTLTREDEDATLVTPGGSLGECEGEAASNVWEDASMRGVTGPARKRTNH